MTDGQCPETGKTGSYLTWTRADQALRRIKRRRGSKNLPPLTEVYRCKTCQLYHLTSQPREVRQAYEKRNARQGRRKTK